LRNIVRWRIADQLRKRTRVDHPDEPGADREAHLAPEPIETPCDSAGERWEEEWQNNLVKAAMDRVKLRVREEQYQMFDLQVLRHWPVSRVAQTLGVSAARVYLAKHRVTGLIKKEVRALQKSWEQT
jgi:DNA-directed RNA polymerase specialized sigma24 family protein